MDSSAPWTVAGIDITLYFSLGAETRCMVNNIIVRADLGVSKEDAIVQLFIGHPF